MDFLGILLTSLVREDELGLARRLKAKDPQALADAYDLYGRIAFALIVRIVHNSAVAEDLVQETFLRVWNRAGQISDEYGSVGPWLLTVARHSALDYVKSAAVRFGRKKPVSDADVPPVTIDHEILSADRSRLLHGAFKALNPSQRQVIELAYYEGLSHQEIADRLHQPLGTVKGWTRSALQRLRSAIDVDQFHHA